MSESPDRSRLLVLWPHGVPLEGLTTVPTDLRGMFRMAERIGPEQALLLVTIRALRQRAIFAGVRLHDLSWMLGTSRFRLLARIERLSKAGLLVYQLAPGEDAIVVELTGDTVEPSVLSTEAEEPGIKHEIPTHWFVQVMPRIGRAAFLAYLLLRSREAEGRGAVVEVAALVKGAGLWGAWHAQLVLRRLERFGLVRRRRGAGLLVLDPPPLTPTGRLVLRLIEAGALPRTRLARVALAVGLVGLVTLLVLLVLFLIHYRPHRP